MAIVTGTVGGVISGAIIWWCQVWRQWQDRDTEKLYEALNALIELRELLFKMCDNESPIDPKLFEDCIRRIRQSSLTIVNEEHAELGEKLYKFAANRLGEIGRLSIDLPYRIDVINSLTAFAFETWGHVAKRKWWHIGSFGRRKKPPAALEVRRYEEV